MHQTAVIYNLIILLSRSVKLILVQCGIFKIKLFNT